MLEKLRNLESPTRLAVIAVLCGVLSGRCGESEQEALMPIVNNGEISICPVNLACAEGRRDVKVCIDFFRCDPLMEE